MRNDDCSLLFVTGRHCFCSGQYVNVFIAVRLAVLPPKERHYNFGQKIFEVGKNSTLAIVTWGLGGLTVGSYRTLIARLADDLEDNPASTVQEVAERWAEQFWASYKTSLGPVIAQLHAIAAKPPFDPQNAASTATEPFTKSCSLISKNKILWLVFVWEAQ